jgi:acylglycerol lipase
VATEVDYTETKVRAEDGAEIFVRRWAAAGKKPSAEVLLLHGYFEHGGRYRHVAHALADAGIATIAPDVRGHGHSSGARGHVDSFSDYRYDVAAAFETLSSGAPRFVLGHSHGGLIALDWIAASAPELRGLVLTNPYLDLPAPVPPVKLWASKLLLLVAPRLGLPSGLDASGISRDPAVVEAYRRDPLVFTTATSGWFAEVTAAQARVRATTSVPMPLLYVVSDADTVVSPVAGLALGEQLQSPDKTLWKRPGEYHEVLNELDRDRLIADVRQWISAHAA